MQTSFCGLGLLHLLLRWQVGSTKIEHIKDGQMVSVAMNGEVIPSPGQASAAHWVDHMQWYGVLALPCCIVFSTAEYKPEAIG